MTMSLGKKHGKNHQLYKVTKYFYFINDDEKLLIMMIKITDARVFMVLL